MTVFENDLIKNISHKVLSESFVKRLYLRGPVASPLIPNSLNLIIHYSVFQCSLNYLEIQKFMSSNHPSQHQTHLTLRTDATFLTNHAIIKTLNHFSLNRSVNCPTAAIIMLKAFVDLKSENREYPSINKLWAFSSFDNPAIYD